MRASATRKAEDDPRPGDSRHGDQLRHGRQRHDVVGADVVFLAHDALPRREDELLGEIESASMSACGRDGDGLDGSQIMRVLHATLCETMRQAIRKP